MVQVVQKNPLNHERNLSPLKCFSNDRAPKALKAKKPKGVDGSGILLEIGAVLMRSCGLLPEKVPRSSSNPPMVFCARIPKPAKESLLLSYYGF